MSDSESLADGPLGPPPKKRGRKKLTPRYTKLTTPDNQAQRSSASKPVYLSQAKWSNVEKRQLLSALRTCVCEDDVSKVYTMVPTKKREEVEAEILKLRNSVVQHGPNLQAPIETWLDFAQEMVHYEEEDHSQCLARAMSIVSNYETFEGTPGPVTPNYKALYKYIAAVLNGMEPPKLSPMDSMIILDLMHSLVDVLSSSNTAIQRRVMKWKFSMLNCKVDINNLHDSAARVRRALTNVFPEEFNMASSSSGQTDSQKTVQTSDQQKTSQQISNPASSVSQNNQSANPKAVQTANSDQAAVTLQPSNLGQNSAVTITALSKPRDITHDKVGPQMRGVAPPAGEPPKKRGRGRGYKREGDPPLEKPQLFSLNPFCVPVEILKLPRTRHKEFVRFKTM